MFFLLSKTRFFAFEKSVANLCFMVARTSVREYLIMI
jgi:hypothetical protein